MLTHHSFSLSDSSSVNDGLVHHSSPVIAIRNSLASLLAQRVGFRVLFPAVSAVFANTGLFATTTPASSPATAVATTDQSSPIALHKQLVELRTHTQLLFKFVGEVWVENCRPDAKQWHKVRKLYFIVFRFFWYRR